MTTSSNPNSPTPQAAAPTSRHWQELTDSLSRSATERFGDWIDARLVDLETSQAHFVTGRSLLKSLRR